MISATNVSHNIVECRAPESNAGYAAVEISHNGVDFSTNGVQFLYVQPATVGNIYPSSGSEKGGTNVTLSGDGFIQLGQLSCIFDKVYSVSAEWIAPSAIACLTPAHQPGVVSVEVSDNGQQTCLGSTNFTYQTRSIRSIQFF